MKISRESRRMARSLFRAACPGGKLDAASALEIADKISYEKPRGAFGALKEFSRLVRLELNKGRTIVSSATTLDADTAAQITSSICARLGHEITPEFRVVPELLGGTRIQIGNDVWDSSIRTRLVTLRHSL